MTVTTIFRDSKISSIIKANSDSIEAIASVAKPFGKLRNPLLRKVLAARTTLAAAARIGGCEVTDLAEALKPLGFVFINENQNGKKGEGANASVPAFATTLNDYPKKTLDVRGDLEAGHDPLKRIMEAVNQLPEGHILELINSFEPTPLISLLGNKGYESFVVAQSPSEIHTFFKPGNIKKTQEEPIGFADEKSYNEKLDSFAGKLEEVDVTMMEMPMPMVTILEALSNLPEGHALAVLHKRIPVFLFSELRERKFQYLLHKASESDIRLLIYR